MRKGGRPVKPAKAKKAVKARKVAGCPKCLSVPCVCAAEPTEADLDYAYGVHGGSKVGGSLPHYCKACKTHPCCCEADVTAAAAERATKERVELPALKTVTVTHPERTGCQYDFTQLPGGDVLIQYHAPRYLSRWLATAAEAKAKWNALKREGWRQW